MSNRKYNVHLYALVRIDVNGVEASTPAEAFSLADSAVPFHTIFDQCISNDCTGGMQVSRTEWAEEPTPYALIDPLLETGKVDYDNTVWLDQDGIPLVGGRTATERKADGYDAASLFMQELLDSVETLTGIAEVHGARTLADLFYLYSAILTDGFIDCNADESAVMFIIEALPSGKRWLEFTREKYLTTIINQA